MVCLLNVLCAVAVRRHTVEPFVFSDGYTVSKGSWICIPQRPFMNNPTLYPQPSRFDAFRFLDAAGQTTSRFTDLSEEWIFWGRGRATWSVLSLYPLILVRWKS